MILLVLKQWTRLATYLRLLLIYRQRDGKVDKFSVLCELHSAKVNEAVPVSIITAITSNLYYIIDIHTWFLPNTHSFLIAYLKPHYMLSNNYIITDPPMLCRHSSPESFLTILCMLTHNMDVKQSDNIKCNSLQNLILGGTQMVAIANN